MKKKFSAGFVAMLLAIGVGVITIDKAEIESLTGDDFASLNGVGTIDDMKKVASTIAPLFCATEDPSCITDQEKMFQIKLSTNGLLPATHVGGSWSWGKNQMDIFQELRKSDDLRVVLSTQDHPCVEKKNCAEFGFHVGNFDDLTRLLGRKRVRETTGE